MSRTRKRNRRLGSLIAAASLAGAIWLPHTAPANEYVSGGTVVYKESGQPSRVDSGITICHKQSGLGVGGGCVEFPQGPFGAVQVTDLTSVIGNPVAFQVCIDNNGDGLCISGGDHDPGQNLCDDLVYFSHDDLGNFVNPLGPLPTARKQGCIEDPTHPGWNGYVVFICDGVHVGLDRTPHSHPSTLGMIDAFPTAGPGPTVFGNYCGGTREQVVVKAYEIVI